MTRAVLCADFGGTKCRVALVAEDYTVGPARAFATTLDRDAFLGDLAGAIDQVLANRPSGWAEPVAIGIGTAGLIEDASKIVNTPNLPLAGFDVGEHLRGRYRLPVTLINDGRASAVGEFHRGDAAGADPLLALFFGTGIGLGLVIGGTAYEGAASAAGEAGHTVHVPGGRVCSCGRRGCFEAYCGGGPIERRALEELGAPPADPGRWRIDKVIEAAGTSVAARRIIDEAEAAAGALVASLATILNPSAIVLGGGLFAGWPTLRESIERATRTWASATVSDSVRFVPSRAGSDAILWGAAAATGRLWS